MVDRSVGFSMAQLKQAASAAVRQAFSNGRDLVKGDLISAAAQLVRQLIAQGHRAQLEAPQVWASGWAKEAHPTCCGA
jgi:hypothetical protein